MPPRKKSTTGGEVNTFMEYVRALWSHRFPGAQPPSYAVKALRPVYKALGDEEATERLRRYLAQSEARFINLWNFAATHPDYAQETPRGPKRDGGMVRLGEALPKAPIAKPAPVKHVPEPEVAVEVDPQTGRLRPKQR
jgi:hypothetical protein